MPIQFRPTRPPPRIHTECCSDPEVHLGWPKGVATGVMLTTKFPPIDQRHTRQVEHSEGKQYGGLTNRVRVSESMNVSCASAGAHILF